MASSQSWLPSCCFMVSSVLCFLQRSRFTSCNTISICYTKPMQITVFTEGKSPPKNEDFYGNTDTTFVVCDGSTSKNDILYGNQTGGGLAARLLVDTALGSSANGNELVELLTTSLRQKREELGAVTNEHEFGAVMACARIAGDKLIVTQVGDVAFRINARDEYSNPPLIGTLMAQLRAQYIKATGDIPGGRDYIMPLLTTEYKYRNNPDSLAGYGEINGTPVPQKLIRVFEFELSAVSTLELYTDGYYVVPQEPTAEAFEALHTQVEQEDPDKCLRYVSTKSKDDRTVMIVTF